MLAPILRLYIYNSSKFNYYVNVDEKSNYGFTFTLNQKLNKNQRFKYQFSYVDDMGNTKMMTSTGLDFEQLYYTEFLYDSIQASNFINDHNVIINRDHHFYENIVKYNHFFAGWCRAHTFSLVYWPQGTSTFN